MPTIWVKNIIENNSERVGIPSSFSRAPSIPSIGNYYAPFVNLYPISERVNDSTQNPPAENPLPVQNLPPSLTQT